VFARFERTYQDSNARLVLIGADHKTRARFAVADPAPEAWRLTGSKHTVVLCDNACW
jgi:hypothetical protein